MMLRLLFFFLMISASGVYAQIHEQPVLVEVGTGVWCASCPTAVQMIDKMHEDGFSVAVVKYHSAEGQVDPFETEATLARINYYQVNSYPTMFIDGRKVEPWNSYQQAAALYEVAQEKERDFRLEITGSWSDDNKLAVRVVAEKTNVAVTEELKLFVAITESGIPYDWYGLDDVDHAMRLLLPNSEGEDLLFNGEQAVIFNYETETEASWNQDSLQVVAFIQDNQTQEIMQTAFFLSQQVGTRERKEQRVRIYPNPANDFLYLSPEGDYSDITLVNTLGKQVFSSSAPHSRLDIRNIRSGVYVMQGIVNGKAFSKKIVIR